jgi:hypothetical protein
MAPILLSIALALARRFGPEMLSGRLAGPRRKQIAKVVLDTAEQMLGRRAKSDEPEAVVQAIEADPAKAAVMRLELGAVERAEWELELRDRMHARETWVALPQGERRRAPMLLMVALFVLLVLSLVLLVVIETGKYDAPQTIVLLVALATACGTKLGSVVDFFFGSSAGSKEKDAALARRLEEEMARRRAKRPVEPQPPVVAPTTPAEPDLPPGAPPGRPPRSRHFVGEILAIGSPD